MKLERIVLRQIRMPLVHFFETSFGRTTQRDIILVEAAGEGASGWGEVTCGERMVAVLWVQSMIRDPHIRQTLFEMEAAITSLEEQPEIKQEVVLLQKSLSNLLRHFTEI